MVNSRDQIQSVSTTLFQTEQLRLQCSVTLYDNDAHTLKYINAFGTDRGKYVSINPNASLKLRYVNKVGVNPLNYKTEYDRQSQIYISPKNIYGIRLLCRRFWESFQRDDMYIYDEFGYVQKLNSRPTDISVLGLDYGQVIRIQPAIYYPPEKVPGEVQKAFPGIGINVNLESQFTIITIDEYTWFMDVINEFNYSMMGQLLLQNYLLSQNTIPQIKKLAVDSTNVMREVNKKALSIFQQPEEKESVSSAPILKQPTTLDEM